MIEKIYEISCDFCSCAIHHGMNCTKEQAIQQATDFGMVESKGKQFCDGVCKDNYFATELLKKIKLKENTDGKI